MTTTSYMPYTDNGKADLLDHLANTLPAYAGLLSISAESLAALAADAACFRYTLLATGVMQAYEQNWIAFKNQLRDGGSGGAVWPVNPALPQPMPPAVSPGIIKRLSALAAQIKTNNNYTEAIGMDCWLIGSKHIIDPSTWKPVLSIQLQAGHPIIVWTKGKAAALEIWVERDVDSPFTRLTINTEPNTTDTWPLPAPGTSAMWKYKAIYLLHDEQVGQWSDVVSASVGG